MCGDVLEHPATCSLPGDEGGRSGRFSEEREGGEGRVGEGRKKRSVLLAL